MATPRDYIAKLTLDNASFMSNITASTRGVTEMKESLAKATAPLAALESAQKQGAASAKAAADAQKAVGSAAAAAGQQAQSAAAGVARLDKSMDDAKNSSGGLADAFGKVATIASGFVVAQSIQQLGGYLKNAVEGAVEDEQATVRLQQAIKNLGGDYDANLAKVNTAIDAGQRLAFSDDQVRDSFAKLAVATGSTDEALSRQKIAMDLARGAHIGLEQASGLLGKVTEENVNVFKRMGITIAAGSSEAEAMGAIQAKFAGQSDAYARSTAGQFEQAKLALGETTESLGALVLPAITKVAGALAAGAPYVQAFVGGFANSAPVAIFTAVVERAWAVVTNPVAQGAIAGIAVAITGLMIPALIAWTSAELAKTAAMLAGAAAFVVANAPVIAFIAVIALLGAGIVLLIQHWDAIRAKVPLLGVVFDAVKGVVTGFVETAISAFTTFLGWLERIPGVGGKVREALSGLRELAGGIGEGVAGAGNAAQDAGGKIVGMYQSTDGAASAAEKLTPLQTKLKEIFGDARLLADEIRKVFSPPTGIEVQQLAQLANIEAAQKALALAMKLTGGEQQHWIDNAKESVVQGNLNSDVTARLARILSDYGSGLIDGKTAQDRFTKAVEPTIDVLKASIDANSAARRAYGETGAAVLGVGDDITTMKGRAAADIAVFRGDVTAIGTTAQTTATNTNTALGTIGVGVQPDLTGPAGLIAPPFVTAAAEAKAQSDAKLAAIGLGVLPSVADPAGKLAPPLVTAALDAKTKSDAHLASIGLGVLPAVADPAGKIAPPLTAAALDAKSKSDAHLAAIGLGVLPAVAGPAASIPPPITAAAQTAKTQANATLSTIGQGVNLSTNGAAIGSSLISGVSIGINAQLPVAGVQVAGAIAGLLRIAKAEAKVDSPSKVWADELGTPLAQGVGVGWDYVFPGVRQDIISDVEEMTDDVVGGTEDLATRVPASFQQMFRVVNNVTDDGTATFLVQLTDFGQDATAGWGAIWDQFPVER